MNERLRALTGRAKGFCVMAGKDHDTMRDVLNRLTLKPRMKEAARNAGIHPTTLFGWIRKSAAGDPKMVLTWLGHEAPFHKHVVAARRLSVTRRPRFGHQWARRASIP
ncbi:MAG: hypothetical protein ABR973_17245 [Candidatus Acidiferrales bacterium]